MNKKIGVVEAVVDYAIFKEGLKKVAYDVNYTDFVSTTFEHIQTWICLKLEM